MERAMKKLSPPPTAPEGWKMHDCRPDPKHWQLVHRFIGPGGVQAEYHFAVWCEDSEVSAQHTVRGHRCIVLGTAERWCVTPIGVEHEEEFADMPWFDTLEAALLHLQMLSEGV
jgi:hypothetical protein